MNDFKHCFSSFQSVFTFTTTAKASETFYYQFFHHLETLVPWTNAYRL